MTWQGFTARRLAGGVHAQVGGEGPVVLLLHGFPETHLMWRDVAPVLAERCTVVAADLPGYGASDPAGDQSKRAMATVLADAMAGYGRFAVVGHDRGGRAAYRLALDYPDRVVRLAVLDVIPVESAWAHADDRFALGYWPWSLLAQAAPMPERLLERCAGEVVDAAIAGWGSSADAFPADIRDAYVAATAGAAAGICDEYRAGAGVDRAHDRAARAAGRRITCPMLALWSGEGPLGEWYDDVGGPLGIWRDWADDVTGEAVPGGHFFVEKHPGLIADRLLGFLTA